MNSENKKPITFYKINKDIQSENVGNGRIDNDFPENLNDKNIREKITNATWYSNLHEGSLAIGVLSAHGSEKEYIVSPASGGGTSSGTIFDRYFIFYGDKFPAKIKFVHDSDKYEGESYFICTYDKKKTKLYVQPGGDKWPFTIPPGFNVMVWNRRKDSKNESFEEYTTQSKVNEGDRYDNSKPLILQIPDHN